MAIGCSISWPGIVPATDQRHERQPGGQRGHQDRREPLPRPAQDEVGPERLAFVLLEVLDSG